jgi:hypothetical protein
MATVSPTACTAGLLSSQDDLERAGTSARVFTLLGRLVGLRSMLVDGVQAAAGSSASA